MNGNGCDILAISTHPDDVELAAGGSIILAARRGLSVVIADLTDGGAASLGSPEQRRAEAAEAQRRLGAIRRIQIGLPDTRVGADAGQAEGLVVQIRALRPRIMLIPFGSDRHPDHAAAAALCQRAAFLARLARHGEGPPHAVDQLIAYEGHHPMAPSFVVDVSDVWEDRMEAVAAYRSQFWSDGPSGTALSGGDFLRFIEARAICHGALIGARYGEAFRTEGPLAATGLESILPATSSRYRRFL